MAEFPCARNPRRHFPGKTIYGFFSKNPVNLSEFIEIFRNYYLHFATSASRRRSRPDARAPRRLRRPKTRGRRAAFRAYLMPTYPR